MKYDPAYINPHHRFGAAYIDYLMTHSVAHLNVLQVTTVDFCQQNMAEAEHLFVNFVSLFACRLKDTMRVCMCISDYYKSLILILIT